MKKWMNALLLPLLFVFVIGCGGNGWDEKKNDDRSKKDKKEFTIVFDLVKPSIETIRDQQFVVRDSIDNCKTFDCIELEKEIQALLTYKFNDAGPVVLGIQQSIVTSITRRCNKDFGVNQCEEYDKEMKRLRKLLKKYIGD